MENQKKIISGTLLLMTALVMAILSASPVSAEFWACFNKGGVVNYCNDYKPAESCSDKMGCQYCMSIYRESQDCYVHGSWPKCNTMLPCNYSSSTDFDVTPPKITIDSPLNGSIHSSRAVLFNINSDEFASFYYIDNIKGNGKWSKISTDVLSLSKKISFKDGLNDITLKAVDESDNPTEVRIMFYVDSQKPKISKSYPKDGFASGAFGVDFSEQNPKKLILNYGNLKTGMRTAEANLLLCTADKGKYSCSVDADLGSYNNQVISYWFELTDIAGNSYTSKSITLSVDVSDPVLNNPASFWTQGEGKNSKYIYFNLSVSEPNFESITYTDQSDNKPRKTKLCSKLKNGACQVKKSFKGGFHQLDVQINDEAGNAISNRIEFEV